MKHENMQFLVYSGFSDKDIRHSLGAADYSYYFVMQRYLPLLESLGRVVVLSKPPADADIEQHLAAGPCVYLSFTPPDKVAELSLCPVIPVFAWEFDSIPNEAFTREEDNWESCLERCGLAITHSRFAAETVNRALGDRCKIASIPAPLWDACEDKRSRRRGRKTPGLDALTPGCTVIDSESYDISNTFVRPKTDSLDPERHSLVPAWEGEPLDYRFTRDASSLILIGFNRPEDWGVWSKSGHPWLMLDRMVSGAVEIEITVRGYGANVGRHLVVELGGSACSMILSDDLETHRFCLDVAEPTYFVTFSGIAEHINVIDDPRDIGFGLSALRIHRLEDSAGQPESILLNLSDAAVEASGFHGPEPVGRWTASERATVELPQSISGDLRIRIRLFHSLHNHERDIACILGGIRAESRMVDGLDQLEFQFSGVPATNCVELKNIGSGPSGSQEDSRLLGLGVASLDVEFVEPEQSRRDSGTRKLKPAAQKAGLLYTAILNPSDSRKNWSDIITAFIYAFRDKPDVTLLVKITHEEISVFFEDIFTYFTELHPFQCRVVFIHGYLEAERYNQLIDCSHYIVNASRGEGQCLPLMEFMSSGVPAIAPANTAMSEYIDRSNAFPVNSSPELTYWPQDPRQVFRTRWHRIDWESLYNAFIESEKVWRWRPWRYRRMAKKAIQAQQAYCSMQVLSPRLESLLAGLEGEGKD